MKKRVTERLADELRRKRSSLLQEVAQSQEELKGILGDREAEIEETAQKDRITRLRSRLDQRGQRMIREIDTALERVADGTYGKCERCKNNIGEARLRAMPTATLCIDCAAAREKRQRAGGVEEESESLPVKDEELDTIPDGEEREG